MKKIIVEADPDGGVEIKVEGVNGPACKLLTRDFEKAIGTVTKDTPTAEMWRTVVGQTQGVGQ